MKFIVELTDGALSALLHHENLTGTKDASDTLQDVIFNRLREEAGEDLHDSIAFSGTDPKESEIKVAKCDEAVAIEDALKHLRKMATVAINETATSREDTESEFNRLDGSMTTLRKALTCLSNE